MERIFLSRTVSGAPSSATTVELSDSLLTYGIIRNLDSFVIVPPTGAITPTEEGDYEYDVSALSAGNYTASWKVTVGSNIQYFLQVFNIDDSLALPDGIYLRTLEQETARLLGPYDDLVVGSSSSNTINAAYIPELISSIGYGGIEDRWMLRRGLKSDGSRIANFNSADRIRRVASVNTDLGVASSDRPWASPPINTEVIEFHHLHPQRELRQAVLAGLRRCYFWDRVTLLVATGLQEINLTNIAAYLTDPQLIRRVETRLGTSGTFSPNSVLDWRPFREGSSILLRVGEYFLPQNLLITLLRPAFSYVNGAASVGGPDDDDDLLNISIDYGKAAAHIEAWRLFRRLLMPVALTGLYPSQIEAAREFTRISQGVFRSQSEPDFPRLEWSYGDYGATS